MRRILCALAALVAVVLPARPAAAQDESLAAQVVALTNGERRDRGLREVTAHTGLTASSCDWNKEIMRRQRLDHDPQLRAHVAEVVPHLRAWGENLAYGPKVEGIHAGWMDSPSHRAHVLDPAYQLVGVCIDRHRDGQLWVTQRFAEQGTATPATAAPAPQPTTPRTAAPRVAPTTTPTTAAPPTVAPTTVAPVTTTTQPEAPTTTTAAPVVEAAAPPVVPLVARPAAVRGDGPSAALVLAVVASSLALASTGVLVLARSRRTAEGS